MRALIGLALLSPGWAATVKTAPPAGLEAAPLGPGSPRVQVPLLPPPAPGIASPPALAAFPVEPAPARPAATATEAPGPGARASLEELAQGVQRPEAGPREGLAARYDGQAPAPVAEAVGLAAAGEFWYDARGQDAPLMKREPRRDNALLRAAKTLGAWAENRASRALPAASALADALLVGDFRDGTRRLDELAREAAGAELTEEARAAEEALRRDLPLEDLDEAPALKEALREVRASARLDPFRLQERLSLLVHGILDHHLPEDLQDLQVWIYKKASGLARARAASRPGPPIEGPLQEGKECWVNALYHLPAPALEAVRGRRSYREFLELAARTFPDDPVLSLGMKPEQFERLAAGLGLKTASTVPSEAELISLLGRHGAVLASVAWFDRDVTGEPLHDALKAWHQHAVAVTGWEREPDGTVLFSVRDSLVPRKTRYTKAELDASALTVFVIERAD